MNNQIVLGIGLFFGAIINFVYCVVACDPQRRRETSLLEFLWILYWVNLGGLLILAPAWLTVETLWQHPDWVLFAFIGGPALFILIISPLAWGYVHWWPYLGE